jgi:hypothetical protein
MFVYGRPWQPGRQQPSDRWGHSVEVAMREPVQQIAAGAEVGAQVRARTA